MSSQLSLPPGFRFHPTDEELVTHYLCRKCASQSISVPIIKDIDLYKYDPWQLPGMALYGEKEWYFFSPRDRKYPNGSRPNRSAGTGYWKATGADKPIGKPKTVGIKKALVFYAGKAPKGVKTNWIMHEYRLANVDRSAGKKNNNNSRLDDWVLCRIYNKKGSTEKQYTFDQKPGKFAEKQYTFDQKPGKFSEIREIKPEIMSSMGINQTPPLPRPLPQAIPISVQPPPMMNDYIHFDSSESIPRLHTESSCSEQVLSPDFTWNKEVQSEPKLNGMDYQYNYMDTFPDDPFGNQTQFGMDQFSPLYDMFMNLQKSL